MITDTTNFHSRIICNFYQVCLMKKRAEYISALSGKALRLERLIDDFYQISL